MSTDALGNAVTLRDAASLAALNDFVEGFIASEARAVNILQAQDDPSAIVQAYCAALHMFAETGDAAANARPFLARAQAAAPQASGREQRFVAAVGAWIDGDLPRAIALHEEQAREHPRDLDSLKLGQYHLFNRGDSPGMLRLALQACRPRRTCPTCTACWPSPGSSATSWSRPRRAPARRSRCGARSPGRTMRSRTSC
jgi:hypothetical protein